MTTVKHYSHSNSIPSQVLFHLYSYMITMIFTLRTISHAYVNPTNLKHTSVTVIGLKNTSRMLTIFLWHNQLLISPASNCNNSARTSRCLSSACKRYQKIINIVRYKIHVEQPQEVDTEKKLTYKQTIHYYKDNITLKILTLALPS